MHSVGRPGIGLGTTGKIKLNKLRLNANDHQLTTVSKYCTCNDASRCFYMSKEPTQDPIQPKMVLKAELRTTAESSFIKYCRK